MHTCMFAYIFIYPAMYVCLCACLKMRKRLFFFNSQTVSRSHFVRKCQIHAFSVIAIHIDHLNIVLQSKAPFPIDNHTGLPNRSDCNKHPFFYYTLSDAVCSAFQNFYDNVQGKLVVQLVFSTLSCA